MNEDEKTAATFNSIAQLLEAQGLGLDELAEHLSGGKSPSGEEVELLRKYAMENLKLTSRNTQRSYRTHFLHLLNGVPRQCECTCDTCLAEFASAGTCSCNCTGRNGVGGCSEASPFPAAGDIPTTRQALRVLDEVALDHLVKSVERMAIKRAMNENVARASRGLPPKPTHGQGAREMCVTGLRFLFKKMVKAKLIVVNPLEDITKGQRSESSRRDLSEKEFAELLNFVATGGNDPALDLAITWAEFELGARRNGIITMTVGALQPFRQTIRLHEKGNKTAEQPCSAELIAHLLQFARARGGNRCVPGHPDFSPNAPVFYFKDSTEAVPHPITGRRFDTLHHRIQLGLPWANSIAYTGHDL